MGRITLATNDHKLHPGPHQAWFHAVKDKNRSGTKRPAGHLPASCSSGFIKDEFRKCFVDYDLFIFGIDMPCLWIFLDANSKHVQLKAETLRRQNGWFHIRLGTEVRLQRMRFTIKSLSLTWQSELFKLCTPLVPVDIVKRCFVYCRYISGYDMFFVWINIYEYIIILNIHVDFPFAYAVLDVQNR